MVERHGPQEEIHQVQGDQSQEELALDPLGPQEIGEECLAVDPDDGKIEDRKRDIQNVNENGLPRNSLLSRAIFSIFRQLLCHKQEC